MSNRTLVELNHDYCPPYNNDKELLIWAKQMASYRRSGRKEELPRGVSYKAMYHHSDPRAS